MDEWPSYYPKDVRPKTAVPTSGKAFRIVKNIPPSREDFKSTYEHKPKDYKKDMWKACGTSLHSELDAAIRTKNRFPKFKNMHIAVGIMVEELGKMQFTGNKKSSHITVWFRLPADPENHINTKATI